MLLLTCMLSLPHLLIGSKKKEEERGWGIKEKIGKKRRKGMDESLKARKKRRKDTDEILKARKKGREEIGSKMEND